MLTEPSQQACLLTTVTMHTGNCSGCVMIFVMFEVDVCRLFVPQLFSCVYKVCYTTEGGTVGPYPKPLPKLALGQQYWPHVYRPAMFQFLNCNIPCLHYVKSSRCLWSAWLAQDNMTQLCSILSFLPDPVHMNTYAYFLYVCMQVSLDHYFLQYS